MQNTPDISSLLPYDFYEHVWYLDQTSEFPQPKRKLGRWLGEAHNFGQAMCYWIMSETATPIVRSSVQPIPKEDLELDELKAQINALEEKIKARFGESPSDDSIHTYSLDDSEELLPDHVTPEYAPMDPESKMPEADDWEPEAYDEYISAEVRLPRDGKEILGTVTGWKRDADGNPVGHAHINPILDTWIHQVTFPDGDTAEYNTNLIAECLYSQVDDEGRQYLMIKEIIDHKRTDEAIPDEGIFQISHNGSIHRRRTTKGWKLCIAWVDGSTSWESLSNMKDSFPVQVAEYAVAQKLQDIPAFAWRVPETLKRKQRMIKAIKTRYMKKTHKYGIRLPKTVKEAYQIDLETGTDHWHKAIMKEMKNNSVAFQFLEDGESIPVGSKWIPFHTIFDIKCDFTRKARFVAGGHCTDAPDSITFLSVVTRDSIRTAFLIAALNELEILAADVGNAYLQAPAREKVHTTAGPSLVLTILEKRLLL